MNRDVSRLCGLVVSASLLVGCGDPGAAQKPARKPASAEKGSAKPAEKPAKHAPHEAGHVHGAGPHGGMLVDWGGGVYHVEFTVDRDQQEATVYILGEDEKTPIPIKAAGEEIQLSIKAPAFQMALKALPQEGDPAGSASRFSGKHDHFGKDQEFAGTISGELDGTPYAADFVEEPHDE
jgi:hypothetical protein